MRTPMDFNDGTRRVRIKANAAFGKLVTIGETVLNETGEVNTFVYSMSPDHAREWIARLQQELEELENSND